MKIKTTVEKTEKIFEKPCIMGLCLMILLIYPLRHVFCGIDLWDTGYNCSNFMYFGTNHVDSMWLFSTYIANAAGHLLTMLPGGHTLLGLNVYSALILGIMSASLFYILTCKLGFGKLTTFVGEFIAISLAYVPTVALYDTLTYSLFIVAIMFIYFGMSKDNKMFLVCAGICLGINVFVRFSNLPQAGMILAVWLYILWFKRDTIASAINNTLWCILGYVASVGIILLIINRIYGVGEYINGIGRLFSMSQDSSSDYSVFKMLEALVTQYVKGIGTLMIPAVFACAGAVLYRLSEKRRNSNLIKCIMILLCAAMSVCMVIAGIFRVRFWGYSVMYDFTVSIITMLSIICVYIVFSNRYDENEKLLAVLMFLQMMISGVGSNTGMAGSMNSMYIALPFLLRYVLRIFEDVFLYEKTNKYCEPVITIISVFIAIFIIQSTFFGITYVFEEGGNASGISAVVHNTPVLKGIRMSDSRAEELQGISDYVYSEKLNGKDTILYGYAPAISFYLELTPAFNSWPDLDSYDIEIMRSKLEETYSAVDLGIIDKPAIVVDKIFLDKLAVFETAMDKWDIIEEYKEMYSYETAYENNRFIVMR